MKNYRFKTQEEFEALYGKEEWRSQMTYNWNHSGKMDYLFGQSLNPQQCAQIEKNFDIYLDDWRISKDMLTEENLKPDFKNGIRVIKNGLMIE